MKRLLFATLLALVCGTAHAQRVAPPSQGVWGYGVYNSLTPTLSDGQSVVLQTDINGNLKTTGGGGGGGGSVTQGTVPWIVKPGPFTIVPLDISVTGSPGAVTVLNAGHATAGGTLVTANAAGMCVDEYTTAGTVTGTPSSTICVVQNQAVTLTPTSGAVSVNSTGSAVSIGGTGLQ